MKRILLLGSAFLTACVTLSSAAAAFALPDSVAQRVERDIATGHARAALGKLSGALAQHPRDAKAYELRCRVQIEEERWSGAVTSCEQAVKLAPQSSNAHLWLGRAYGGRAQAAGGLTALKLARRLHNQFETAVQLAPDSVAANESLGEFYTQAPGFLGGSLSKPEAIVRHLRSIAPARAHALAARIAENRRNYTLAEKEWKQAVQTSQQPAKAWMQLAAYYRRRGRFQDMVKAAETGAEIDHQHGCALVSGATVLIRAHRNFQEAEQWLREYLASDHESEDAPAFAVRAQLSRLLRKEGKVDQARQEMAAAHALAPGYSPHS